MSRADLASTDDGGVRVVVWPDQGQVTEIKLPVMEMMSLGDLLLRFSKQTLHKHVSEASVSVRELIDELPPTVRIK